MEDIKTSEYYGFNTFMKTTRIYKKISLTTLAEGLYSISMIKRIEDGERLPDRMMRELLTGRLGICSEHFEDYVQNTEYKIYIKQMELICAVEDMNYAKAKKSYAEFLSIINKDNRVEMQFLTDMKARIDKMAENNASHQKEMYEKALLYTVPKLTMVQIKKMVLSTQEYYLINRYLMAWSETIPKDCKEEINRLLKWYQCMLSHIEKSEQEPLAKVKVFPMLVVSWYQHMERFGLVKDRIDDLYKKTEEAISLLRTQGRIFFIIPILEIRQNLYEDYKYRESTIEKNNKEKEWLNAIKGFVNQYGDSTEIDYNCYIYKTVYICRLGEVIKKRREMLGISQKSLARGICDYRTILRLEKGDTNVQFKIIKPIMERLGLFGGFRRTMIVSNECNVLNKYHEFTQIVNQANIDEVKEKWNYLKKNINTEIEFNRQFIEYIDASLLKREKITSAEQDAEMNQKALYETLPKRITRSMINGFFSIQEIQCMYGFLLSNQKGEDSELIQSVLLGCCRENGKYVVRNYVDEFLLLYFSSQYGNNGEYEESNELIKMIASWEIKMQRVSIGHICLYDFAWNRAMQHGGMYGNEANYVWQALQLSDFCMDERDYSFYREALKKIKSGDVSWMK